MDNELYHYGILGMKWGIRRYQNSDGSLTEAGKKRYGSGEKNVSYDSVDAALRNNPYDGDRANESIRKLLPKKDIQRVDELASEIEDIDTENFIKSWDRFEALTRDRAFTKEIEEKGSKLDQAEMKRMLSEHNRFWNKESPEEAFHDLMEDVMYEHIFANKRKYYVIDNEDDVRAKYDEVCSIADKIASQYIKDNGDSKLPDKYKREDNANAKMYSDVVRNSVFPFPLNRGYTYSDSELDYSIYIIFADKPDQFRFDFSNEFKQEMIKKLEQIPELKHSDPSSDELYHYGILGMKWGVRRYQNEDGTLTEAGKEHYQKSASKVARKFEKADKNKAKAAKANEQKYKYYARMNPVVQQLVPRFSLNYRLARYQEAKERKNVSNEHQNQKRGKELLDQLINEYGKDYVSSMNPEIIKLGEKALITYVSYYNATLGDNWKSLDKIKLIGGGK